MLSLLDGRIYRRRVQLDRALRTRPADPPDHPAGVAVQAEDHQLAGHLRPAEVGQQASEPVAVRPKRSPSMFGNQRVQCKRAQTLAHPPVKALVCRLVTRQPDPVLSETLRSRRTVRSPIMTDARKIGGAAVWTGARSRIPQLIEYVGLGRNRDAVLGGALLRQAVHGALVRTAQHRAHEGSGDA